MNNIIKFNIKQFIFSIIILILFAQMSCKIINLEEKMTVIYQEIKGMMKNFYFFKKNVFNILNWKYIRKTLTKHFFEL